MHFKNDKRIRPEIYFSKLPATPQLNPSSIPPFLPPSPKHHTIIPVLPLTHFYLRFSFPLKFLLQVNLHLVYYFLVFEVWSPRIFFHLSFDFPFFFFLSRCVLTALNFYLRKKNNSKGSIQLSLDISVYHIFHLSFFLPFLNL